MTADRPATPRAALLDVADRLERIVPDTGSGAISGRAIVTFIRDRADEYPDAEDLADGTENGYDAARRMARRVVDLEQQIEAPDPFRVYALDHAVEWANSLREADAVVAAARTFDAFLRGDQ